MFKERELSMKKIKIFYLIIIPLKLLFSQINNAPEVTNVTFSQRTDGTFMVDVYYDVNDTDDDTMSVTMQVSDDAGTTWDFSCQQISGDVGADITSGTSKHIVWDFGSEHPQTYGEQFQIKIIADDNFLETGTVTDIDGNVYKTVKIGEQWWMAENLKVTHYRNGDAIPNVTDNTEWEGLSTGAMCSYDNDDNNIETYGLLYNWYAVDDSRNIAPAGWHVPTDEEWKELEMYLGMSQADADNTGSRGTDEGGKLKETGTSQWTRPNTGATNESGFSALPGGYRIYAGIFSYFYLDANFWSATEVGHGPCYYRSLHNTSTLVSRHWGGKRDGASVRCFMD
jgi:uncharacterized protein (TIGR02145 family)